MVITEEQIRGDLYRAYFDARQYKRNTLAQLEFEEEEEVNLEELYPELVDRTYKPLPAFCFITFDPVQREVFASQFRDRVIQHMLYNYLAPLFDTLLIYDTYSCRVGKGTHFGMERFCHHIRSCTENYQYDAHVLLIDLSGYFMSIDKALLMKLGSFEIATAEDGKKALDILTAPDAPNFDLVLTDMWMPEMDGVGLVQAIRANKKPSSPPVYVVTADVEMLKQFKETGFTGILLKPITVDKLKNIREIG